ncbi:hypothetical protein C8Q80DRAFT_1219320 [Daedaleopsis nitida]|nr:hypothetical protein C8Q80DRAFT_1219320 [Daedaleopsis nitida]
MYTPILPAPAKPSSAKHQYETRIRSNSAIKPSVRLRQSPDAPPPPRRVKPIPSFKAKHGAVGSAAPPPAPTVPFPPPHVVLHADDASSKVFHAIGRALMSVDNRAMTVKDLAEQCMKCGLMCQNLSAAGQAITTFIRNHLQRCDTQQDQPLLLRHIMSGTGSDDDLVPALFSRVGGAHCTQAEGENRLTNFRRGTMVWYLSKAAGAPCPFAKAGIRLCDYDENGKVGMPINPGREKKRERDRLRKAAQSAGQKRKRLLRSCADNGSESETSSDEEEERPPKVKLTLKLKPCPSVAPTASSDSRSGSSQPHELESVDAYDDVSESDESDSDSMSIDSDDEDSRTSSVSPPYSRPPASTRRGSLPEASSPPPSGFSPHAGPYRRSPSVPYSDFSGSPPPESEEEDDAFQVTMTGTQRPTAGRPHTPVDDEDSSWEEDFFGDFDADTQWESPGPRSPSVQIEDDIVVKQEPTDVSGFLDAWDDLESRATELKVIDVVAQAAAAERQAEQSTSDDFASWTWPSIQAGEIEHIKQEDIEANMFFTEHEPTPPSEFSSPIVPYDPWESPVEGCPLHLYSVPCPSFELQWRDVEILGPDSVKPRDLDDGVWHEYRGPRAVSPEERIRSSSPEPRTVTVASPSSSPTLTRSALTPLDVHSTDPPGSQERNPSITSPTLIASLTSLCIQAPAPFAPTASSLAVPSQLVDGSATSESSSDMESVVFHTIVPSTPAISATLFEGVPVYQMTLDITTFLRRMDTNFVNVSSIAQHLNAPCLSAPDAVTITAGSPLVCGMWAPLVVARDFATAEPAFKSFLSDDVCRLFPEAVGVLCSGRETAYTPFGHQFKSASDARRVSMTSHRLDLPPREFEVSWEDHLATHPPFILATAAIDGHRPTEEEEPAVIETPLSPTEEEMFHVLCAAPEWETPPPVEEPIEGAEEEPASSARPSTESADPSQERPLRRSKRVAANAVATRSRTRSSRRGSRTSLS